MTGWSLDVRCRQQEATAVLEQAITDRSVEPGTLCARERQQDRLHLRAFRARLAELEVTHRRGGYRDPESQAFIESWFSKLKQRCIWREEFETLDDAREEISRTSTATTTGPAAGSTTSPREKSRPSGRIPTTTVPKDFQYGQVEASPGSCAA